MEVMNIIVTNNYSLDDTERMPMLKDCIGREGLQFMEKDSQKQSKVLVESETQ